MQNEDHELSTEELLNLCNREENFRSILVSLLETESIEEFDAIVESASEHLNSAIIPFMNDLREIYSNSSVRFVVVQLLKEKLTQSQVRGLSFLLNTHVDQVRRVGVLRSRMYRTARETIEQYVPVFDELTRFLADLDSEDNDEQWAQASLTDRFYEEIREAVNYDHRITGGFLKKLCHNEQFRNSLESELNNYPEVIQTLWKMAENLVKAQRYLADIEIEDLLHDIEEHRIDM